MPQRQARASGRARARVDDIFHALGDPTRRKLFDALSRGPRPASRLAEPLGITLTAVGQHVRVLERSGLVRTEKVGRVRTCRVDTAGLSVLEQWAQQHRQMWERRLDRLGELLEEDVTS